MQYDMYVCTYVIHFTQNIYVSVCYIISLFCWNIPSDYNMLNKNSLGCKKVQGQSEATMVISNQKF